MKKKLVALALALTLIASPALAARFDDIADTVSWLNDSKIFYSVVSEHDYLGEVKLDNIWWYGKDAEAYSGTFSVFVIGDNAELEIECHFTEKNIETFAADVGYSPGGVQTGYYDEQRDIWVEDGKLHLSAAFGYPGEGTEQSPYLFSFAPYGDGFAPLQSVVLMYEGEYIDEYWDAEYLGWIGFSAIIFTKSQLEHFQATGDLPPMLSDTDEDVSQYTDLQPLKQLLSSAPTVLSSWAVDAVNEAIALNILPEHLRCYYSAPATRAEFCALAASLYEAVTGAEITERSSFSDTDDVNVEKMAALGVVNGIGDGLFAPDATLTREQAAAMLSRLAGAIGKPLAAHNSTFSDTVVVSDYAQGAVGQMQASGVMTGVGNNVFAPKSDYTREQSIVTIMRLYEIVK